MKKVKHTDYKALTPGSECLVIVCSSGIWFGDDKYGVNLIAKAILMKPGEKKQFGLNDFVLESTITE